MSRKQIYVLAVSALLLLTVGISVSTNPRMQRVQQHLEKRPAVEDTNLSIEADTFSTHLPLVSIETGGQVIPGKPGEEQKVKDIINTFIPADMKIIDQEEALNTLAAEPAVELKIQVRVRGTRPGFSTRRDTYLSSPTRPGTRKRLRSWGWRRTVPGFSTVRTWTRP